MLFDFFIDEFIFSFFEWNCKILEICLDSFAKIFIIDQFGELLIFQNLTIFKIHILQFGKLTKFEKNIKYFVFE